MVEANKGNKQGKDNINIMVATTMYAPQIIINNDLLFSVTKQFSPRANSLHIDLIQFGRDILICSALITADPQFNVVIVRRR